ncbi:MAG TPA: hypothetical protein PLO16_15720 [Acidocella sp.]|nr:hypothetical protein [Acidocella sp.]
MSEAMTRSDQLKMRLRAGRPLGEYLGKEAADRIEALEAALDTAIALLWEHVPGISPRIEFLEAAREGSTK